jgi:hypothetical protein
MLAQDSEWAIMETAYEAMERAIKECGLKDSIIRQLQRKGDEPYVEGDALTHEALEERTRGQAETPEWHAARHGRITGSKAGSILACVRSGHQYTEAKYKTKLRLAGEILSSSSKPSDAMKYGSENEKNALIEYAKRLDENEDLTVGAGLHVHPQHTWLACSPDGVYRKDLHMIKTTDGDWVCATSKFVRRLLEVKCPYSKRADTNFETDHKFYLKKVGDEYQINMHSSQGRQYYYQIQVSLAVLDMDECDLVVWSPEKMVVARVKRQPKAEEEKMISDLYKFWHDFIERAIDPSTFRHVHKEPETLKAIVRDAEDILGRLKRRIPFEQPAVVKRRGSFYPPMYQYPIGKPDFDDDSSDEIDGDL